ncbi:MAG: NADPH-dependent reductase [Gammaproteobacteria bacterium]|nr:NADPH-dependent reductase [Gammaproteobacteria bacterium]
MAAVPEVRKGQESVQLTRDEFARRFRQQFYDPVFELLQEEIDKLCAAAWDGYENARKSPRTLKAGAEFADPDFDLSVEWLATRDSIEAAGQRHHDPASPSRVLLISGASRNDQTCPGELPKSIRLLRLARAVLESRNIEVDVLDLSHLSAQYGRRILPCKACVSTAMPLCHWPCSCYPNHSLGQVHDWMNELYPRFVAAHGILIVTPVYWYQSPSGLKLLMDRLVCADGGNPDPTTTRGKDPRLAKQLELAGWHYPRHLAGRAFAVVVHGDAAGVETLRRALVDWLTDMRLVQAGDAAALDRYVGYYGPYASSHEALDADFPFQEEVRNAARALANEIQMLRQGRREPDEHLHDPRPK